MVEIDAYLRRITGLLQRTFGERLLYVGLQGSYLRGEAREDSDVDIMTVLDELTVEDLDRYREVVATAGYREKSCGFLCGRRDLLHWNACEICHLLHTTRDYYGELAPLVPSYTLEDVRTFVKLSVGNLYHALCHTYVHAGREAAEEALPDLYKQVFFILQNLYFLRSRTFVLRKNELLPVLDGLDRRALELAVMPSGIREDFAAAFSLLFTWCRQTLHVL